MNPCESSADEQVLSAAEAMREVNLAIFEVGTRQFGGDGQYTFFCECGDPDCRQTIRLHLHRFDPSMPAGSVLAHVPDGEQEPMN